jgi:hypothetical protein
MTPTLYPHEWILKHIKGIDVVLMVLAIVLMVDFAILRGRFFDFVVLSILMVIFSIIIFCLGQGQYYGRRI